MDSKSACCFFRGAHLNLNHCRRANLQLSQDITSLGIDFCSVNDPYVWENKVTEFSSSFRKYFYSSRPLAGFIISNTDFLVLPVLISRKLVALKISFGKNEWLLVSIYCPPSHDFEEDLDNLIPVLIQNQDVKTLILGDFNAKSPIWGPTQSDKRGDRLMDLINQFDLTVVNDNNSLPSFVGHAGRSWIDLLLIKNFGINGISDWKIDDRTMFSDHQIMDFFLSPDSTERSFRTTKWSLDKIDFFEFKMYLSKFLDKCTEQSIDFEESIEYIQNGLIEICSKTKRKSKNKVKKNAIWWNIDLAIQRSKTRALRRRFQATRVMALRTKRQIIYKLELAKYTRSILEAKKNSFRNFLKSIVKTNTFDSFYRLIKDNFNLLGDLKCIELADGNFTTTFKQSMQTILFYHFPPLDHLQPRFVSFSDDFPAVSPEELKMVLKDISPNKAPGIDGLTHGVVGEMILTDLVRFTNIFNTCFERGIFPKCWKVTKVVLIPKEGKDLSQPSSYRPICLLPTWGKILDKVITQRLVYELETGQKLHRNQYGFRKGKSTALAMDHFLEFVKNAKTSKLVPLALSLDMSNAFNSVNWEDIIDCLIEDGISPYLINIIKDFLSERKIIDRENNIEYFYSKGIPQGSSLGPVLWLAIADRLLRRFEALGDKNPYLHCTMFADDILLLSAETASYKFTRNLEAPIRVIETWARDFGLAINPTKSKFIVFPIKREITHIPRLKINGKNVKCVKILKYLGISFDIRLNWLSHFDEIKKKVTNLQSKINRLSRATWGAAPPVVKEIYKVAIEKLILYGAEIWYDGTARCNKKLLQIQRLALLKIAKTYTTVSTEALQILTGCEPLDLLAERVHLQFKMFNKDLKVTIGSKDYSSSDFDNVNIFEFPPWDCLPFYWRACDIPLKDTKNIFTDGSKLDARVGSGVVCLDQRDNILWQCEIRLNDEASVFLAEAYAIFMALQKTREDEAIGIYTDSQSVLRALESPRSYSKIIVDIKKLLRHRKYVKFYWVKAHIGTYGNELADVAAKEATRKNQIEQVLGIPKSWLNYNLKYDTLSKWQKRWEFSLNSRFLYGLMPIVNTKKCYGDFFLNQILTTHGCFPQHQNRFFGKSPLCICGTDFGTVSHYIFGCPRYHSIRSKFFPPDFLSKGILELVNHHSAQTGLKMVIQDVLELSLVHL